MLAASNGNTEIVEKFLSYNFDLNHKIHVGNTALIEATKNRHYEVVKLLLDADASPSKKNQKRQTPLDIAKTMNDSRLSQLISEHEEKRSFWPF